MEIPNTCWTRLSPEEVRKHQKLDEQKEIIDGYNTWPFTILLRAFTTQSIEIDNILFKALSDVTTRQNLPEVGIFVNDPRHPDHMSLTLRQPEQPVKMILEVSIGQRALVEQRAIFSWHPDLPRRYQIPLIVEFIDEVNTQIRRSPFRLPNIPHFNPAIL